MSYLPPNVRVELQGLGRSGRKSDQGSGRMIIYSYRTPYALDASNSDSVSAEDTAAVASNMVKAMEFLRDERDMCEEQRMQEIRIKMIPRVMLERQLFERFDKLQEKVKAHFLPPPPSTSTFIQKTRKKLGEMRDQVEEKVNALFYNHDSGDSSSNEKDEYWSLQMKSLHNKWALWLDSMSSKISNAYKSSSSSSPEASSNSTAKTWAEITIDFDHFAEQICAQMKIASDRGVEALIDEHGELIKLAKFNLERGNFCRASANCEAILRLNGEPFGAFAHYYGTLAACEVKKDGFLSGTPSLVSLSEHKLEAARRLKKAIALFERDIERIQMRSFVLADIRSDSIKRGIGSSADYFTRSNCNEITAIQVSIVANNSSSSSSPSSFSSSVFMPFDE